MAGRGAGGCEASSERGLIERQHKDIKSGLKTALYSMQDRYGAKWSSALPWVLLARRTAYQPELATSPAELVFGQMPRLPGDVFFEEGKELSELLNALRTNAAKPPIPTAHHRKIIPFMH